MRYSPERAALDKIEALNKLTDSLPSLGSSLLTMISNPGKHQETLS